MSGSSRGWNRGPVTLWDASDRRHPREAATLRTRGPVASLALSPRAPLLITSGNQPRFTGGIDGWATLWNLKGGRPVEARSYTLKSYTSAAVASFSPDGRLLALPGVGSGLFDMADPNRPRHLKWAPVAVFQQDTAFSAQRRLLAVGESVDRVDGTSLSEPATELSGSRGRGGRRVTFHPEGSLLAATGDQGTAVLWDIGDLKSPHIAGGLPPLDDRIEDVAFTPDGRTLLTGGGDGTLRLWSLGTLPAAAHDPQRLACQVAGSGLDRTQWRRHAPGHTRTRAADHGGCCGQPLAAGRWPLDRSRRPRPHPVRRSSILGPKSLCAAEDHRLHGCQERFSVLPL
ncbi:WD40 repeat domain-containing protein [Streptomyces sp. NBRC 110611]|uniref:WD40 repeat domain-containing protein n=1 Tax=Streptomyces sp. NBRC 110611 TaxID=1621259 RepID=UPI000B185E8B|nr:WD40 repeat domain-containing protein [Streptomyces sp. NBRC 110611]